MASGGFPWPDRALDSVALQISSPTFAGGTPWKGHSGWVQFAGSLLCGDTLQAGPDKVPLAGEWIDAAGAMHRLHAGPAGQPKLTTVTEAATGEAFGVEEITVFGGKAAAQRRLTYRVFWREGALGALDRAFDMFAGFAKGGA